MKRRGFLAGAAALLAASGRAATETSEAHSGDRFTRGGEEFRLADILAPSVLAGEPFAEAARGMLQAAIAEGTEALQDVGPPDRWGRRTVRAFYAFGGASLLTVEERLVAAGAVRVRPETDDYASIRRLLDLEDGARRRRDGLWRLPRYQVHAASAADGAIGGFSVVAGAPLTTAKRGGRVYLNFGEDFRSDFTASARSGLGRIWAKAGLDLEALVGRPLRVRGHVARINGPSMELVHPLQVELLDSAAPGDPPRAPA